MAILLRLTAMSSYTDHCIITMVSSAVEVSALKRVHMRHQLYTSKCLLYHSFDDEWPVNRYNNFVTTAGCAAAASKFDCLVSKDTLTLQWASNSVSTSQIYGTW